ncbi:DUF6503 family protein [Lewinella sp. W8]|uniref:DUF6503 family protein n=1 Tax=Lewinella sp. W8 TaxID=2528208 RepID=UPI0010676870|nr:DUF6503 family protein [Lewinella sp. W8]MTB51517.1 hypothetical protein [Lewinella sp. W8]
MVEKIMPLLLLALIASVLAACNDQATEAPSLEVPASESTADPYAELPQAERIIALAVEASKLTELDSAAYTFRFRDKEYGYENLGGQFKYERWWTDSVSGDQIRDVLTNIGLQRFTNGTITTLSAKDSAAYANSVNSVIYFAFMPYPLQDPAVRAEYLGQETIRGEILDKLGITFAAEGGGQDYEDEFRYWFDPSSHQLKYLAYTEAGNKAPRFRQAFNEREEAGIMVRDYHNFHIPKNPPTPVDELAPRFNEGNLKLLSEIIAEEYRDLSGQK